MNPIRVMVVDDSVVVRKIVTDVLSADPDIEVVGTAVNGKVALAKLDQLKPDLVTMDIEMPEMDGIEAVRAIRAGRRNRVPIIMFSTLTERGASATLDALSAGANDYVTKPANVGSVGQSMESVREQLIPKIKALTGRPVTAGPRPRGRCRRRRPRRPRRAPAPAKKPAVLVIGSSTGGPEALARVLPAAAGHAARAGPGRAAHAARLHPPVRPAARPAQRPARGRGRRRQPARPRHRRTSPPATTTSSSARTAAPPTPACRPGSTRARRRTSAGPPSTRCSARPSPPTTAPSWPSS